MQPANDPSLSSHYITDDFYQKLITDFAGWDGDERECSDPTLRDSCRRFLEREARLLDQGNLDAWAAIFSPECLYWVPATPSGGDPRREVAVSFDDRRRLEDRLYRLQTDYAWSQQPQSRTVRLISNVEVFSTDEAATYMVRSNFTTNELRGNDPRTLTGWNAHRLQKYGDTWLIRIKQVNLINCDQNLRNPSLIL
jgi:3-phenylpropionate/cinnamic acid dioxygenase small subunit